MARTFEELAGQELDALYQGALFLSGGNARAAETLLVDAVTQAFQEYPYEEDIPAVDRWLEARLVRSHLKRRAGEATPSLEEPVAARPLPPEGFAGLGSHQLFSAAGELPAWPRAALYLVLLRRWSYSGAAKAMGVDRETLVELLRYRDVLIGAVSTSSRARPGLTANGG